MPEEKFDEVNLFDEDTPGDVVAAALEADEETTVDEFVTPDKFKDKSTEDVIKSYQNLESEFGRKSNEVGELRKLTDEILRQNVEKGREVQDDESNEVGFDDLIEDPKAAIDKALAMNPRLAALEAEIKTTAQANAHSAVLARHEDADTLVASPEFQTWISENPARQKMFAYASDKLDAGVASEMLDLYKSTVKMREDAATVARDAKASAGLKNATNEKGGKKPSRSKKVYKRTELIHLKISNPRKYEAMADDINLAYTEGRVR